MKTLIENYVDEMMPTEKQKKKLMKLLGGLCIIDSSDKRYYRMPIGMGVPYKGGYAAIDDLRRASTVKIYSQFGHRKHVAVVVDQYGNLWLRSNYDDSVYDDYRELYIGVDSVADADDIVERNLHDNDLYYDWLWNCEDEEPVHELAYPYLRCNNTSDFTFVTKDKEIPVEERYRQIS